MSMAVSLHEFSYNFKYYVEIILSFVRLVTISSSPKLHKVYRSIELVSLNIADELELESVEPARQRKTSNPSLLMALCHTYIGTFLASGFLKLITDLLDFVGPLILK